MRHRQHAFSLLELSIVIAMIGLIAGVVLVAQSFAERNKLRSIVTQANEYAVAIHQFRDKYSALPGDMLDATRVWGTVGGGVAQCVDSLIDVSTGDLTCNGDGNGMIDDPAVAGKCEGYRAWQQMKAAGFIKGHYIGISGLPGCTANSQIDVNVPAGPIDGTGFSLSSFGYYDANATSTLYYDGDYSNAILFGAQTPGDFTINPAISPEVAREIDQKSDDGVPRLGNIRTYKPGTALLPTHMPNCATLTGDNYNEAFEENACALFFMNTYMKKN